MNKVTLFNGRISFGKQGRPVSYILILGACALILLGFSISWFAARIRPVSAAPLQTSVDPWQYIDENSISNRAQRQIIPTSYRTLRLNKELLASLLEKVPLEFSGTATTGQVVMTLPMPDGSLARFSIVESPIMEPELARAFPEIRTFRGQGIDDATAMTRFDWTPEGLHAMVLSAGETVLIDPYAKGDTDHYISYYRRDNGREGEPFHCSTLGGDIKAAGSEAETMVAPMFSHGSVLRTYRLAVAATGEYTNYFRQAGDTDEQAKGKALEQIVTTVNRINLIFERELAVRFVLVSNELEMRIIYTNPATDPYTDGNTSVLIDQNQSNLDNEIGGGNYDIGHVFGASGAGGRAYLYGVCTPALKGGGATTVYPPTADSFAIGVVSHEIGHQFGAHHTFNGTSGFCGGIGGEPTRNPSTAYEVGSGSTIMSYAAACYPQDLQGQRNDYYHINSLERMLGHINGGGNCASQTATGNNPPTVNAGPNYTIPRATPFSLTATGSDPDGDPLTYTWEEFDLGPASPPDTDADGRARPIFRTYLGTASPTRTFPALNYILDSANVPPTNLFPSQYLAAEALPVITRVMTFKVTARDNRSGGGGISSASMQLNVTSSAGPFFVTQPNTAMTWTPNSQATVTWNVANTTAPPVSCANVKIMLSTDGGNTFPIVLAASTPNDGSETITVPNVSATRARVRVESVGNIFFDISDTDFIIPASGCSYSIDPLSRSVVSSQVNRIITVTPVPAGCSWEAKSNAPWIRINSTENGIVSYTVLANSNGASRTGTISVAGQTHTVTQNGSGTCSYSISRSSESFLSSGGTGRIDITTAANCNWVASSNAPWIVIISGSASMGSGIVLYAVTPNDSSSPRTGTLTVAGFTFTVTQGGSTGDPKITPISATASGTYEEFVPSLAIDGNVNTNWNSGGDEPQWIQIDLGQAYSVSKVRLNVNQVPEGDTIHEVYGGLDPQSLTLLHTFNGFTQTGQWLEKIFSPAASNVRYLKISTTFTPSWVAWNEIEAYGRSN